MEGVPSAKLAEDKAFPPPHSPSSWDRRCTRYTKSHRNHKSSMHAIAAKLEQLSSLPLVSATVLLSFDGHTSAPPPVPLGEPPSPCDGVQKDRSPDDPPPNMCWDPNLTFPLQLHCDWRQFFSSAPFGVVDFWSIGTFGAVPPLPQGTVQAACVAGGGGFNGGQGKMKSASQGNLCTKHTTNTPHATKHGSPVQCSVKRVPNVCTLCFDTMSADNNNRCNRCLHSLYDES